MSRRGIVEALGLSDRIRSRIGKGIAETLTIRGHVTVELFDAAGELKDRREVSNLVTTVGRAQVVEQLLASPAAGTKVTHMGVGTSGTAPAVGDTTITGDVRVALTSKSRSTNVLTMVGDWGAGVATATLQEAGCWDASSGGTLHARATFGAIAKAATDTLKITWTWTIG